MTYRYRQLPIDHPNKLNVFDGLIMAVVVFLTTIAVLI
jgi:hypothetical protein